MILETASCLASSQIPQAQSLVPGPRKSVVAIGRQDDVTDEMRVTVQAFLWDTIVGLVTGQFPYDQGLVWKITSKYTINIMHAFNRIHRISIAVQVRSAWRKISKNFPQNFPEISDSDEFWSQNHQSNASQTKDARDNWWFQSDTERGHWMTFMAECGKVDAVETISILFFRKTYHEMMTRSCQGTLGWWQFGWPSHCDPKGFRVIAKFHSFFKNRLHASVAFWVQNEKECARCAAHRLWCWCS